MEVVFGGGSEEAVGYMLGLLDGQHRFAVQYANSHQIPIANIKRGDMGSVTVVFEIELILMWLVVR
jgi:hypothetical protein